MQITLGVLCIILSVRQILANCWKYGYFSKPRRFSSSGKNLFSAAERCQFWEMSDVRVQTTVCLSTVNLSTPVCLSVDRRSVLTVCQLNRRPFHRRRSVCPPPDGLSVDMTFFHLEKFDLFVISINYAYNESDKISPLVMLENSAFSYNPTSVPMLYVLIT